MERGGLVVRRAGCGRAAAAAGRPRPRPRARAPEDARSSEYPAHLPRLRRAHTLDWRSRGISGLALSRAPVSGAHQVHAVCWKLDDMIVCLVCSI